MKRTSNKTNQSSGLVSRNVENKSHRQALLIGTLHLLWNALGAPLKKGKASVSGEVDTDVVEVLVGDLVNKDLAVFSHAKACEISPTFRPAVMGCCCCCC